MAASAPLAVQIAARQRAVFAAARAAGIDLTDAAERRRVISGFTGGRRAGLSECTLTELGELLDHLNRGKNGYSGRRRSLSAARAPLLGKIDALLAELHRATGKVHTLKYADAIARRNGWAECVDFADEKALRHLIGALNRTLQYRRAGN